MAACAVAISSSVLVRWSSTVGTIVPWNPAAERLLGRRAGEAIGQTLALLIPPAARPAHVAGFHRAMETGRADTGSAPVLVTLTRADGTAIEVALCLGLLADADGAAVGAVAAMRPAGPRRPLAA